MRRFLVASSTLLVLMAPASRWAEAQIPGYPPPVPLPVPRPGVPYYPQVPASGPYTTLPAPAPPTYSSPVPYYPSQTVAPQWRYEWNPATRSWMVRRVDGVPAPAPGPGGISVGSAGLPAQYQPYSASAPLGSPPVGQGAPRIMTPTGTGVVGSTGPSIIISTGPFAPSSTAGGPAPVPPSGMRPPSAPVPLPVVGGSAAPPVLPRLAPPIIGPPVSAGPVGPAFPAPAPAPPPSIGQYAPNLGITFEVVPYSDGTLGARLIQDPEPGAPASQVPLRSGDVVYSINGARLTSSNTLLEPRGRVTVEYVDRQTGENRAGTLDIP